MLERTQKRSHRSTETTLGEAFWRREAASRLAAGRGRMEGEEEATRILGVSWGQVAASRSNRQTDRQHPQASTSGSTEHLT